MSVTLRDVAKAAGVSPMAVSKVLHGKGSTVRVSPEKATAIQSAARALNYQPNSIARSLKSQRTHNIALVFEHWLKVTGTTLYFSNFLDGVTAAAFPAGYTVSLCPKLANRSQQEIFDDGRFDGLIWCKFMESPQTLRMLSNLRIPVVMIHVLPEELPLHRASFVCCDNHQALDLAVDHLVSLGHQNIAFINDEKDARDMESRARIAGFYAAMTKHNLRSDADVLLWHETCDELDLWWEGNPDTTAVICKSEAMAVNLLNRAKRLGIDIPAELSVVGFDSSPTCETTQPRLTSIFQPIEAMARQAAEVLIHTIEGRQSGGLRFVHSCGFDVRESTDLIPQRREESSCDPKMHSHSSSFSS
jgi:LacI family transcriptional regulator